MDCRKQQRTVVEQSEVNSAKYKTLEHAWPHQGTIIRRTPSPPFELLNNAGAGQRPPSMSLESNPALLYNATAHLIRPQCLSSLFRPRGMKSLKSALARFRDSVNHWCVLQSAIHCDTYCCSHNLVMEFEGTEIVGGIEPRRSTLKFGSLTTCLLRWPICIKLVCVNSAQLRRFFHLNA